MRLRLVILIHVKIELLVTIKYVALCILAVCFFAIFNLQIRDTIDSDTQCVCTMYTVRRNNTILSFENVVLYRKQITQM